MEGSIPEAWKTVKVQDLAAPEPNSLIGNTFGSRLKASEYISHGIPILRGENLAGPGRFNPIAKVFVTPEKAEELAKQTATIDDVVFTQQGTNRHVGIITEDNGFDRWIVSQSQMRLRVNRKIVDPLYVYYYASSAESVGRFWLGETSQIVN
jgi:type I restriction enzyme, S subunit